MNKYLLIRSLSRNATSTSSTNCQISMPANTYLNGRNKLKLEYFIMYNTMYNISTLNQNLDFSVSSTTYTATVPVGFYNASTFATALQTALNAALSNTFVVTYNTTTLTFTIAGASSFDLLFKSGPSAGANNTIWQVMGFASANGTASADSGAGMTVTSNQVVNFSLPLSFYINFPQLSGQFMTSDKSQMSLYIPNTAVSGGGIVEFYANESFQQIINLPPNTAVLQSLNIEFQGPNASSVDLNGSEYEMLFSII